MTNKQLEAKVEMLEQRIAALEARDNSFTYDEASFDFGVTDKAYWDNAFRKLKGKRII